jgi:DNA-binding transcriptional ArsR family regulator
MANGASFMLVSLEEAKAKKLAQVISNETCTKLLNYLAKEGEGTETEIAKALGLPLSTVHYNLKQLVEAKLVLADEYHYSQKGREVLHYKLANKYIIIAPQEERESFLKKLQQFLPVTLITLGTAGVLKMLALLTGPSKAFSSGTAQTFQASGAAAPVADEAAPRLMATAIGNATEKAAEATAAAVPAAAPPVPVLIERAPHILSDQAIAAFLIGALFVIGVFILIAYVKYRRAR